MHAILQDCRQGKLLSRGSALSLVDAEGDDLQALLATAAELRDRYKGRTVTYSPKIFVPLTNLCRDFCGYCTFRKAPDEPGAKTMRLDEVLRSVRQGKALGCTEVLFSLGDKPEAIYPEMKQFLTERGHQRTLDYLVEACRVVLEETGLLPHSNPGVMGRGDLQRLKEFNPSMGLMLESVSERLLLAGAAHDNAPDKKPAVRLRTLELAGELRIPFTTGILIGIGENWPERIDSLLAIRELHERYGHIQEVIVQNFRAKSTTPMRGHPDATQNDMVKTIALARLILGGGMNIQAPPNLTPDGYELYLDAGINDWGGVSPLTPDFINPEAPWPALRLLQEKSAQAGFELKARLPIYPEYIRQGDKYLPARVRSYIEPLCDADGLVKNGGPLGNAPVVQHSITPPSARAFLMLVVLTGGTGGAKLIEGLAAEIDPAELTIICNTGDDAVFHGLYVSPDIDTITYTLAGLSDNEKGWGIHGDTFTTLEQLRRFGNDAWFNLGDKDLATHITRTKLLNEGLKLCEVTERIRRQLGVQSRILPMSDERVETRVQTPQGEISFQEFFVKERWAREVNSVRFVGAEQAQPAPGVLDAIHRAQAIVVCPSNPITSIGPILAVPGIRSALKQVQRSGGRCESDYRWRGDFRPGA